MDSQTKHTLVVGGTKGIGRAVARKFASEGNRVSVIGRRTPLAPLDQDYDVIHWAVDVLNTQDLSSIWPKITGDRGPISNVVFAQRFRGETDEWTGEIETGLTATRNIIEILAAECDEDSNKSVVVISSIASQYILSEQPVGYHVSKAGLDQLVRYYAATLGSKNFRVNAISPGTVVKEESQGFYRTHESIGNMYNEITPLGRMATSEDIAGVAWLLCSQNASFVTGQNITVDGGLCLVGHQALARRLTGLDQIEITQQQPKEQK
jgi:NAD(P)-dependent dehydrogenase (short-subunit alcohol dehydrogenase family)